MAARGDEDLVTVPEAAVELGVSAETLHYWLRRDIPRTCPRRDGRKGAAGAPVALYRLGDLRALLASRRPAARRHSFRFGGAGRA